METLREKNCKKGTKTITVLLNKKILLFSQYFFGYEEKIAQKLREYGAAVSLYDEMSVKTSFERALIKISPNIFRKKTESYYRKIIKKEEDSNFDFVLFIDCEMPTGRILKECRKAFPNAKFCLYMWDSLKNLKGVKEKFKYFDYISSFDREDANRNHLVFRPLFFSDDYKTEENSERYRYDLAFVGTIHSDRYAIIKKLKDSTKWFYIYPYLQSQFIYYYYKMIKHEFKNTTSEDFKFDKIDSKTIIKVVRESRAILDIQHPKQTGLTMRTLEMLGMKKKFVTTNTDIQNYDFYNENNICIIDRENPSVPDTFYVTEYREIPENIYEYYSIDQWVLGVLGV